MIFIFSPQRRDDSLNISKIGEILTINGVEYDFTQLPDGATLPRDAIDCEWICGDVNRVDGELVIPILLPHGPNPTHEQAFPEPITVIEDGPINLNFVKVIDYTDIEAPDEEVIEP